MADQPSRNGRPTRYKIPEISHLVRAHSLVKETHYRIGHRLAMTSTSLGGQVFAQHAPAARALPVRCKTRAGASCVMKSRPHMKAETCLPAR